MKLHDLSEKKIGIFGFGEEGESLLGYLVKHSINNITVFDENDINEKKKTFVHQNKAKLVVGAFELEKSRDIEIAFRSPGLKKNKIQKALSTNAILTSPTNLFFSQCKGKTIAITGTKGKSTTVNLISEILKQNSINYFIGGNIGNSPLEFVDSTNENTVSVLELSSFQLEDFDSAPNVAIYLPIYLDHLDFHLNQGKSANFHENKEEYFTAKGQLVSGMSEDSLIVAHESENVRKIIANSKAKKIYFSTKEIKFGCYVDGERIVCRGKEEQKWFEKAVLKIKNPKVPIENVLAALTYAYSQNLNVDLSKLLSEFKRLPYRIQLVAEKDGLKYFNDSASTNPISAIAAMKTMDKNYTMIMGGSSKDLKFNTLAEEAAKDSRLQRIYLVGDTSDEIEEELNKASFKNQIFRKKSLADAVSDIKTNHDGIFSVLFSPASASFDQFTSYRDRGETFNRLINEG